MNVKINKTDINNVDTIFYFNVYIMLHNIYDKETNTDVFNNNVFGIVEYIQKVIQKGFNFVFLSTSVDYDKVKDKLKVIASDIKKFYIMMSEEDNKGDVIVLGYDIQDVKNYVHPNNIRLRTELSVKTLV